MLFFCESLLRGYWCVSHRLGASWVSERGVQAIVSRVLLSAIFFSKRALFVFSISFRDFFHRACLVFSFLGALICFYFL